MKRVWAVIFVVCCMVGLITAVFMQRNTANSSQTAQLTTKASVGSEVINKEPAQTLTTRMLFVGELFWGRGIEYYSKRSPLGYAFPFSGLSSADRAQYDAWVADLECPVTAKDIPYQTQVDKLLFNCRPEYLPEAAKWFNAVSLANNHTNNNDGLWGMDQTRLNLEKQKIQYFGDYDMQQTDNICEVVAMPAQLKTDGQGSSEPVIMPIALCGYDYVGNVIPRQNQFDVMNKYSDVMPVIAMPHMGVEYRPTAEDAKVVTYRKLIDNGADIVIGAHPHVIQNSENYKGRLIQYSTGNFMFDQQSLGRNNILDLGVDLKLSISDQAAIKGYLALTGCEKIKDDCAKRLTASDYKRPEITVSYGIQCFEQSTNIPKKASDADCAEIMKQATWQTATANLDTTW